MAALLPEESFFEKTVKGRRQISVDPASNHQELVGRVLLLLLVDQVVIINDGLSNQGES
jgi:hypothetical protein